MRQRLVIGDGHADAALVAVCRLQQGGFEGGIAGAEHGQASAMLHQFVDDLGEQVHALLPSQA
ncbi:hypothetical protein D3C87_1857540 [compost metagenome]